MTTVLAWASVIIGVMMLSATVGIVLAAGVEWWRYQKRERAEVERRREWMLDTIRRERVRRAYNERYYTIPIDAESDADAVDALIAYSRRAA